MKVSRLGAYLTFFVVCLCAFGCGGGNSDSAPVAPTPTTELSGTLTLPTTVNSLLLTNIRPAQNTDSEIRNAFASATVYVNDAVAANRLISPTAATPNWDLKLLGVPQNAAGLYRIHLIAGRLALKAWVKTAKKDAFTINSRSTAAALLAESSKIDADALLATYPAMIAKIANQIETAYNASSTEVKGTIFNLPAIQTEIASQADFIKKNKDYDSKALVAYLGTSNDLDGNGLSDLRIVQTIDRTGIRFETAISTQTSLMDSMQTLASYPDKTLLNDFTAGNTRGDRTFDANGKNFGLGLYFSKGAAGDTYLKLLVKRIDLSQGTFNGVYAEYSFVTATGTAIATGTKTLLLKGSQAVAGAVEGTNFIADSTATSGYLVYIDTEKGLGNLDSTVRMVRAVDGQPDLSKLSYAETYGESGTGYYVNTGSALKVINKSRSIEVGDVFAAYFKGTGHYALFKIKAKDVQTVTVDYVVNTATNEPYF